MSRPVALFVLGHEAKSYFAEIAFPPDSQKLDPLELAAESGLPPRDATREAIYDAIRTKQLIATFGHSEVDCQTMLKDLTKAGYETRLVYLGGQNPSQQAETLRRRGQAPDIDKIVGNHYARLAALPSLVALAERVRIVDSSDPTNRRTLLAIDGRRIRETERLPAWAMGTIKKICADRRARTFENSSPAEIERLNDPVLNRALQRLKAGQEQLKAMTKPGDDTYRLMAERARSEIIKRLVEGERFEAEPRPALVRPRGPRDPGRER